MAPEDPIAHGELAALTRRYENNLQIIRGDISSLDNQVADLREETRNRFNGVDERLDGLSGKLDSFIEEQRAANARLIELLAELSAQRPPE